MLKIILNIAALTPCLCGIINCFVVSNCTETEFMFMFWFLPPEKKLGKTGLYLILPGTTGSLLLLLQFSERWATPSKPHFFII